MSLWVRRRLKIASNSASEGVLNSSRFYNPFGGRLGALLGGPLGGPDGPPEGLKKIGGPSWAQLGPHLGRILAKLAFLGPNLALPGPQKGPK